MSKTALITGASTGIGREFACIHAEKGGNLVIVARNSEKLEELKGELESAHSVKVHIIVKDLGVVDGPREIYEEIRSLNIKVDYLINNAGFGGHGKFHERDWQQDLSMINLNVIALSALTRLFLPDFVQRNEGRILNVSSTACLMPGPLQAVYYATKAYITFFSNAVAEELYDTNVTVTTLIPGATETEFAKVSGMDKTELFKKTFSPRLVAQKGYDGMMRAKLDVVAGVSFPQRMMFYMLPFFSKKSLLRMIRKIQEIK